ncbi:MAG: hypothetical protein ABIP57_19725 [Jatrophihabitantaceae bacterium]
MHSPAFRPITRHGQLGTPTDPDPNARLTGQSVALIVKNAVALLDDPARFPPASYAGHSLRAGFATQAAVGVSLHATRGECASGSGPLDVWADLMVAAIIMYSSGFWPPIGSSPWDPTVLHRTQTNPPPPRLARR